MVKQLLDLGVQFVESFFLSGFFGLDFAGKNAPAADSLSHLSEFWGALLVDEDPFHVS